VNLNTAKVRVQNAAEQIGSGYFTQYSSLFTPQIGSIFLNWYEPSDRSSTALVAAEHKWLVQFSENDPVWHHDGGGGDRRRGVKP